MYVATRRCRDIIVGSMIAARSTRPPVSQVIAMRTTGHVVPWLLGATGTSRGQPLERTSMTWPIECARISPFGAEKVLRRAVHHPHRGAVYGSLACLSVDCASGRSSGSGQAPADHCRGRGEPGDHQERSGLHGTRRHEPDHAAATVPDQGRLTEGQRDPCRSCDRPD
jgi:hypothetical protein